MTMRTLIYFLYHSFILLVWISVLFFLITLTTIIYLLLLLIQNWIMRQLVGIYLIFLTLVSHILKTVTKNH